MTAARTAGRLTAVLLTLLVAAAVAGSAPASGAAVPPSCTATLFSSSQDGVHAVEQGDAVPGAVLCSSGATLRFSVGTPPQHGTIEDLAANGSGGATFTYTPAAGHTGPDTFELEVTDGESAPVRLPVSVDVRPATNDVPECEAVLEADQADGRYRVEAGSPVDVRVSCFDDEGQELSFTVATPPTRGTLGPLTADGASAADAVYTPGAEAGTDTFAVVASDGTGSSAPATVRVAIVDPVDDPPVCTAEMTVPVGPSEAFEVERGSTAGVSVFCDDDGAEPLRYAVGSPPAHGSLSSLTPLETGDGVDAVYTPQPSFEGYDRFTLTADDGANAPVAVPVRVRVVPERNDVPRCTVRLDAPMVADRHRVEQGRSAPGRLTCSDETDPLDLRVGAAPGHGVLSALGADGAFTYTAAADHTGPDEFSLVASDGVHESRPVAVAVEVTGPVDDRPECQVFLSTGADGDGAYLVDRGRATSGRVVCTDDEGAAVAISVTAAPGHGALSALTPDGLSRADFTYTPSAGYLGADRFELTATDGTSAPVTHAVSIRVVEPTPRAPRCTGRLHTPTTPGGSAEVESGESVQGTLTCFAPDGGSLTPSIAEAPARGAVSGLESRTGGARFTYTADGTTGPDALAIAVSDGTQSSNLVPFVVEVVEPYDAPPECSIGLFVPPLDSGAYPAEDRRPNRGVVSCRDDEGGPLAFDVTAAPQHGALAALAPAATSASFDYVGRAGYAGPDAATVRVRDAGGGEDVVELRVQVAASRNAAPTCTATLDAPASGGSYAVAAGQAVAGRLRCQDADADALTTSVLRTPTVGALSPLEGPQADRTFTFTAPRGPGGDGSFVLRAADALDARVDVPVAVRVAAEPGPVDPGPGPVDPGPGPVDPGPVSPVPPAPGPASPASPVPPASPVLPAPPGSPAPPAVTPVIAPTAKSLGTTKRGTRLRLVLVGGSKVSTTVTVRSVKKLRTGKGKARLVTFLDRKVTGPGTIMVPLSGAARLALKRFGKVQVLVRVVPTGGRAVEKRLTLKR